MSEFYTMDGERPDIALEVKMSQLLKGGYVWPRLFPVIPVSEKGGSLSYCGIVKTNAVGVSGREDGAALTSTAFASSTLNWTVTRLEGRYHCFEHEVKGLGGIASADRIGGMSAGRLAMNAAEVAGVGKVFSSARQTAATELTNGNIIKLLQGLADVVVDYGEPWLVCSSAAWRTFCGIPEIRKGMMYGLAGTGNLSFLSFASDQVRTLISNWMRFAGVMTFDSRIVSGLDNFMSVIGLNADTFGGGQAAIEAIKQKACYGASMLYLPDGANPDMPFRISSFSDREAKKNEYDADGYYGEYELNASAVGVAKFLADLSGYTE